MSNVWFTSDLHIGHKRVAELRDFWDEDNVDDDGNAAPDTEAHDEHMAYLWDSSVQKNDIVFVLGDISINGGQHALNWIGERPGRKQLIAGNHDPVHPANRRSFKLQKSWLDVFESIQSFQRIKVRGIETMLSHFPYWPHDREGTTPRYEQYRLPDLGMPLLHGHTHDPIKLQFPRSLHVGIDAWGSMVSWLDVENFIDDLQEDKQ